jgi:hypothetical protein
MLGALVTFDDLKATTGYARLADVERCLKKAGIRYFYGRGGVWTTVDLINAAGGGLPANDGQPYRPDDIV